MVLHLYPFFCGGDDAQTVGVELARVRILAEARI